jgi:dTDP-4-dehydrorhamnose 3,5-epimerase-like enzyme
MTLNDVRIIQLPKILDRRGNLTFIEGDNHIPFEIKRTYWIYDVPGGEIRGGHAFKEQDELIVALSGSFDIVLDDGFEKKTYQLNRSYYGLYVPNGIWRQMENFSTNSLSMILASTAFNKEDYIFDYELFCKNKDKNGRS